VLKFVFNVSLSFTVMIADENRLRFEFLEAEEELKNKVVVQVPVCMCRIVRKSDLP
jgi:hypothetical protein